MTADSDHIIRRRSLNGSQGGQGSQARYDSTRIDDFDIPRNAATFEQPFVDGSDSILYGCIEACFRGDCLSVFCLLGLSATVSFLAGLGAKDPVSALELEGVPAFDACPEVVRLGENGRQLQPHSAQ